MCKEMPVIPTNKVVDKKRIIGKSGTRGRWPKRNNLAITWSRNGKVRSILTKWIFRILRSGIKFWRRWRLSVQNHKLWPAYDIGLLVVTSEENKAKYEDQNVSIVRSNRTATIHPLSFLPCFCHKKVDTFINMCLSFYFIINL
jgi:hypothetical protein